MVLSAGRWNIIVQRLGTPGPTQLDVFYLVGLPLHVDAGPDRTVECASPDGTPVTLDGANTNAPKPRFSWSAPGVTFDDSTAVTPTGRFPTGTTPVVLRVSSGAATLADTMLVTVHETQPPTLIVALTIERPRGRMECPGRDSVSVPGRDWVPIHAQVTATDACDTAPVIQLVAVTALERNHRNDETASPACARRPPRPNDHHEDVWGADTGTADLDFFVRREHRPFAYTACYRATDAVGLSATACDTIYLRPDRDDRESQQVTASTLSGDTDKQVEFSLGIVPNPGTGPVEIRYGLPSSGYVRLRVFDVAGRLVGDLVARDEAAGPHAVTFRDPQHLGPGLYTCLLEWAGRRMTAKFVTVK